MVRVSIPTNPEDLELQSLKIFVDDLLAAEESPADVLAPLGFSQFRVEATTADGTVLEDSKLVKVSDTTPPVIMAWFEDVRTGETVTSIDSKRMEFVKVHIEADDICDPEPEVSSVLGSAVEDNQLLRVKAGKEQVSLTTKDLTLMVSTSDVSGNATSLTTTLKIESSLPNKAK